jgi:hypothetical protein
LILPIPVGIQVSFDNNTFYKLSDHNRSPISISYDIVEKSQRMANGTMRKYVIANKIKVSVDWKDLPTIDSNLVDYIGSSLTTTVVTPAPTSKAFIPAPAIATQSFTQTLSTGVGGETQILITGTVPPVNSIVTLSGLTSLPAGYPQNGSYVVKAISGQYITLATPGVTIGVSGLNATLTWVNGTAISTIVAGDVLPGGTSSDTWFVTKLTNAQLTALISVGTAITIFGAPDNTYNNTFTVGAINGSNFLVTGLKSSLSIIPLSQNSTYFITGTYSNPGTSSNVPSTYTTYTSPFGAAWIKSFYEANVFSPIYVKLTFAQDTNPSYGNVPLPSSYTDSLATSGQIINAFITNFTYDVTKRRIGSTTNSNSLAGSASGYDLVDVKIEFTEI